VSGGAQLVRGAVAGLLIVLATAGAVAGAALLQIGELLPPGPGQALPVDEAAPREPQTLMILGSDRRFGDRDRPRADTILLVRLDPRRRVTAVMSVPRDLLVRIPGHGAAPQKINAAFHAGGAALALRTVRETLSAPGRRFRINHVITVQFRGFREAVDYIGGVYVDVDRDYFNDNSLPGEPYATIDVDAGYQRLGGRDALDYVRYRHGDEDRVRAARQQDFLREVRHQPGVPRLTRVDLGNLRTLSRRFGRYFDYDRRLHERKQVLTLAKLVLATASNPVREVRFRSDWAPDGVNLVASPRMLRASVDEFLGARAPRKRRAPRGSRSRRAAGLVGVPGLRPAHTEAEDLAILGLEHALAGALGPPDARDHGLAAALISRARERGASGRRLVSTSPARTTAAPASSAAFGRSPRRTAALSRPNTGTSRLNGATTPAGWRRSSAVQVPKPNSVAPSTT
jgi:polyisoprenyl-teichoic acid--peptidoglycan teichoic acid transferase